jgi:predicted transcriptional regulator
LVNRPKKELKEDAIELRRERVLELTSQGYSQRQIANMLQIANGTVANDQIFQDSRLKSINTITREAWTIVRNAEDNKEKIQALSLAKECHSMKLVVVAIYETANRTTSRRYRSHA